MGQGSDLLSELVDMAREAGGAVLDVYSSGDFGVSFKEDRTPLTEADMRSHRIIEGRLARAAPGVPVLSEEGAGKGYAERLGWGRFFLVDPLDGTKEFLGRNGEFTINIALVEGRAPVMGVVYVPARDAVYYASRGEGAFRAVGGGHPERIAVRRHADEGGLVVATSRSHGSGRLEEFLAGIKVKRTISAGSALKFCLVAEGEADIYPRFGPTWEWDTAAGHAVVSEAGGVVCETGGGPLLYNKPSLKHEGFIASSPEALRLAGVG